MTARERVLSAINHKEPDKIPVDLGGTPSSGISAIAYNRLVKHTGIENKANKVYDVVQQVTQPEEEVLDLFHVDVVDVGRSFHTGAADWHDATLADGSWKSICRRWKRYATRWAMWWTSCGLGTIWAPIRGCL